MTAKPWSKFYWPDWQSDPAIRACSPHSRGIWIEFLAIMHQANPRGYLLISGQRPSERTLANLCGCRLSDIRKAMVELEQCGVPSINERGEWFNRRMTREEHQSQVNTINGKQGGNPKLIHSVSDKRNSTDTVKPDVKAPLPPNGTRARGPEVISQKPEDNPDPPRPTVQRTAREVCDEALKILQGKTTTSPNWYVHAHFHRWITAGCDPDLDILPTIQAIANAHEGDPIYSWEFFDRPVLKSHSVRTKPQPNLLNGNGVISHDDQPAKPALSPEKAAQHLAFHAAVQKWRDSGSRGTMPPITDYVPDWVQPTKQLN